MKYSDLKGRFCDLRNQLKSSSNCILITFAVTLPSMAMFISSSEPPLAVAKVALTLCKVIETDSRSSWKSKTLHVDYFLKRY